MLARCARVAPARMRTASSPSGYLTARDLSFCSIDTPADSGSDSEPRAPLIVTAAAVRLTVTPVGTSMIRLATLDMIAFPGSGDDAEHFAALADGMRRLVGHDALGRRHDHGPHAAQHPRELALAPVDAQPGTAHALDAVDDRAPLVVLELDGQQRLAFVARAREVSDVTLVLQHREDRGLELRGPHGHARLAGGLPVADARQQVGDRIGHAHL